MTHWIFQGNPTRFDVDTYLTRQTEVLWGANQGFTMMKPGDRVYFWRSRGDEATHPGIIATGTLTEAPREQPEDPASAPLWRKDADHGVARRVAVRVAVRAGQRLLPAVYLAEHAQLRELEILKVPNATNFRVGESREAVLADEWEKAATRPARDLLVESLASAVEGWRADPGAQALAKAWSEEIAAPRAEMSSLVQSFLDGKLALPELKGTFDRKSRTEWRPLGLAGPNGAMVLNKWGKNFDTREMTPYLIDLLQVPATLEEGERKLIAFQRYLRTKIDAADLRQAGTGYARMPSFVSAIWQAWERSDIEWPTMYTSARDELIERQMLLKQPDPARMYLAFRDLVLGIQERYRLSVDEVHKLLLFLHAPATSPESVSPPAPSAPVDSTSPNAPRVWAMSPGKGAKNWETWKRERIAAIGWNELGDLRQYRTVEAVTMALGKTYGDKNPVNNRWACFEFGHEMKPGDVIYVKRGKRGLLGVGVVEGEYRYEPARAEEHHVRDVRWEDTTHHEVPRGHLMMKTLTDVTSNHKLRTVLEGAYAREVGSREDAEDAEEMDAIPYTRADAARELFLEEGVLDDMLSILQTKKNLILQGPPGVGKTFVSRRLAYLLMGEMAEDQVAMVQFHQSYSYEDFVEGFRPTESGGFRRERGLFLRFCERATQDRHSPYVLIIDEINRGNLSRIFGELLMLLEADKRGKEWAVRLTYGGADDEPFFIPPNLYVIGTMNTADRSLALVDYALRRRFAFVDVPPGFDSPELPQSLRGLGVPAAMGERICGGIGKLNSLIVSDVNLGPGYRIGHSYFCDGTTASRDDEWLERVCRTEIEPLLKEYWRDSPDKVITALKILDEV